jgi:serine/threonine protein kinase
MGDVKDRSSWGFEPGTLVGSGRVAIRKLGGGNHHEAWLGWDEHLASTIVLKLLRPQHAQRRRARKAIAAEASMLRDLAHPGIVRCFDADLDGERPYLVLEFLEGPRLSTLIRKYGPLAPEQLAPLAIDIGSALAYLHNEHRLHLDVKPGNIIMGAPPRLIDLSIARSFEDAKALRRPVGTDAYMAPEQCDPELLSCIGPWTDVWGLGATVFEAANGVRPFPKREGERRHPQLTVDPAPFHPRVREATRNIIAACLARQPDARPSIPEVMEALDPELLVSRTAAMKGVRRRVR